MFDFNFSALTQNIDFWVVVFRCLGGVVATFLLAMFVASILRTRCPECGGTMKPKSEWHGNKLYECQSCGEEGWTLR